MPSEVVFIGCGDIATRTALTLQDQSIRVLGVRRDISGLPEAIPAISADVLKTESLGFLHHSDADTLVYSLAASAFDRQSYTDAYIVGLRNTIAACNPDKLKRLIFISSTATYHQNDGSLVDEQSETKPTRFNGQIMLQAEKLALETGITTCVRYSGIYGPDRLRMVNRVLNGQCTPENTNTLTNRIHIEDCAGFLAHLIVQDSISDIINATDSSHVTANEIESFIAEQLGIAKQYSVSGKSPRIAGSKRCSNQRMLDTGYRLKYPDYRSGYASLIDEYMERG